MFVTLACGEKVHIFIAIGKPIKFLDWSCVVIISPYNVFCLFTSSLSFFFFSFPPGMSESEQALKGTSQIKILSPEDIEGMRVVCRVRRS